jgi:hypothetical protein
MRSAYRHLAFTGTKKGITKQQELTLHRQLCRLRDDGFLWMHNGDCVGADYEAATIWYGYNGLVQLHPPIKDDYRAHFSKAKIICEPRDYLVRDKDMVECSELLVATPRGYDEERRGSGTWATVRYARKLRLQVLIIYPNGLKENES